MEMKEMVQVWMETKAKMEVFIKAVKGNKLNATGIVKFSIANNLHMTSPNLSNPALPIAELKELAYQTATKVIGSMERMIERVEAMMK